MNAKLIAIVAVVILAGATAGVIIMNNNNGDDEGASISIVDGAGKTIELNKPLSKVATINSNIPKAMIMLGLQDTVKCYHSSNNFEKIKGDNCLGSYYSPSVETLLSYDVEAVLCPVTSMTLLAGVAKSCEENGIKVIRLDCYGDSTLEDVKKLSKLFGEPDAAVKALDRYEKEYNDVLNAIKTALGSSDKMNYLYLFGGLSTGGSIVNERSGLSEILAPYYNKNVTEYTDLAASVSGISNAVNDGTTEALQPVQDKIDVFAMRMKLSKATEVTAAATEFKEYVGDGKIVGPDSPAYQNNKLFAINTSLVSGLYGHIGILIFVKLAYGVDVEGYNDINKVLSDSQAWTGLDLVKNKEVIYMTFDSDGNHSDTKFAMA